MNATLSSWSDELLTEPTKLIVGLDINESLRLVVAEADSGPEPVILERHCFRSLEGLQRYLQRPEIWNQMHHLALHAAGANDPHGASSWLYTQNIPVHGVWGATEQKTDLRALRPPQDSGDGGRVNVEQPGRIGSGLLA